MGPGPKNLAARAAAYLEAITAARAAGYSWAEIAQRIGAPSAEATRKAVARAGRYKPVEQLPLPEPELPEPGQPPQPAPAQKQEVKKRLTGRELFDSFKI